MIKQEKEHIAEQILENVIEPQVFAPVRFGKWEITDAYPHNVYCSVCHTKYAQTHWAVWNDKDHPLPRNYCPNCGAKMEVGRC